MSGSISVSKSTVDGSYASVNEQSGITAGDGGFNVHVAGNTDLAGGKIASTDKAVQDNKNSLTTGTLTQSDIANHSDYEASSMSISVGGGYSGSTASMNGTGIGFGNKSGSDSSTTINGISGGTVTINDAAGQLAKTGKTVEKTIASINTGVSTAKDTSGHLTKGWDGQQLMDDVTAQAQITAAFGKEASKGIGTYATSKENDLRNQAKKLSESDPAQAAELSAEADKWGEGGVYRVAMHVAAGALSGGLDGALGAATSAVAMPRIADAIKDMDLPDVVKQGIEQVAAAALGAAVGGAAGIVSSVNVEANNRQLHQSEYALAKKNAALVARKLGISVEEAEGRIVAEMQRNSDKQTADAAGGKHDYEIRSIIGCQNLNCNGYKNDPQYANHDYNNELIAGNQAAYNMGQGQLGSGQTYNDLVTGNIKQDPVGSTLAGAGMVGLGVVTGGGLPTLWLAGTGATLGLGANGSVQLGLGQPFDWYSFGIAGVTGAASSGMGFIPAILTNTGGALAGSGMQGQNPNGAMAGAVVGTAIGYTVGSKLEGNLNNIFNPWYRPEWVNVGMGLSTWVPKSPLPSWFGGLGAGITGEIIGDATKKSAESKR
jgi:filamentous hemagglutinin